MTHHFWAWGAALAGLSVPSARTSLCSAARASAAEMLLRAVVALLGHLELPPAAVCPIFWCLAKIKPGTPLLQFHIPAVSPLHGSLMSNYHCGKMKGGKNALHRQSHQLFLSDLNGFERVAYFSLIISPLNKFTKDPKSHCSNECHCPQDTHERSGVYFSLQSKGKSNKLIKKINECNISHRQQEKI